MFTNSMAVACHSLLGAAEQASLMAAFRRADCAVLSSGCKIQVDAFAGRHYFDTHHRSAIFSHFPCGNSSRISQGI
jgi:hypothetical protein